MVGFQAVPQKRMVYYVWLFSIIGGLCVGLGFMTIYLSRLFTDAFLKVDSKLYINYMPYSDIQLVGAALITIGIISTILSLIFVSKSHRN